MEDIEIFGKAIQKAHAVGWEKGGLIDNWPLYKSEYKEHYAVIFSHDFAKAFWGEDYITVNVGVSFTHITSELAWKHHLKQMIVKEDPLRYLEMFLNRKKGDL